MEADWFLSGGEPTAMTMMMSGLGNLQGIGGIAAIIGLGGLTIYGSWKLRQIMDRG